MPTPPRHIRSHAALRGVAALLVVMYHLQFGAGYRLGFEEATAFFQRSYLAVDLFFVLSGFIISYVNDAERRTPVRRGEVASFFRARLARLYPLHVVCLFAMATWALLEGAYRGQLGAAWAPPSAEIFVLQLFLLIAWAPGLIGWNVPSWSISAELVAYALFPLLVTLHARRPRMCELGMLALSVAIVAALGAAPGGLDITGGLAPARCIGSFMLGMLVYYRRPAIAALAPAMLSLLQVGAVAAIVACLALPVPDALVVPAFVVLVATTWSDAGLLPRLLATRPLLWLGEISYSVYLTHVPLIGALDVFVYHWMTRFAPSPLVARGGQIALVFVVVLAVSHLTFNHVERPARQWLARRWLGHRAPPIADSPAAP